MDILIREADGIRRAGALVIGRGVPLGTTAGGLPELLASPPFAEAQLTPSGGDDTGAIQAALASSQRVRLGPGTFRMSGIIQVGTGQSIVGCGPERTTVQVTTATGPAFFHLSGSGAAIEELTLRGSLSVTFDTGIYTTSATNVRLRGLHLRDLGTGIWLTAVNRLEISRVSAERNLTAISVSGSQQVAVEDVHIDGNFGSGIILDSIKGLRCVGVTLLQCQGNSLTASGSGLVLQAIHLIQCEDGLTILNGRGVEISGVHATEGTSFSAHVALVNTTGALVSGCSVLQGRNTTLSIDNCTAVTVSGFHSDMTGTSAAAVPHVVVGGGSTQVMISGIHVVNPAAPPQYEVDVSAAGGRVLFAQHDFDPARINSGGNFAET
ncbi:MAG TPA: right-handed parallel beta-helix repeat-containing protein [Longimicrobium sp.]|nr:right-handed parallel beta-helix repeat-containing protein [Longimicrobium sp.]